jgi:hypothetical protein
MGVTRGSAVSIAIAYRLDDREVEVRVPVRSEFSLLHIVETGFVAYPASYPVSSGGFFPRG